MDKDVIKNTYKVAILFSLLLSRNCYANPIAIVPGDVLSKIGIAIVVNSSVDFFVLAIGYASIKSLYYIMSLEFFPYLFYVIIMGFVVDIFVIILVNSMGINHHTIPTIGLAFIFLSMCNIVLCRSFWGLPYKQAAIIGMMMGLFTNPYIFPLLFD